DAFGDEGFILFLFAVSGDLKALLTEGDFRTAVGGIAFDAQDLAVEATSAATDKEGRAGRDGAHERAVALIVPEDAHNIEFADQVLHHRVGFDHALFGGLFNQLAKFGAAFFQRRKAEQFGSLIAAGFHRRLFGNDLLLKRVYACRAIRADGIAARSKILFTGVGLLISGRLRRFVLPFRLDDQ